MSEAVTGVNKKKLVWTFCVFFCLSLVFLAMYFISFLKTDLLYTTVLRIYRRQQHL